MPKRILPLIPAGLAVKQVIPSADQITIVTTLRTATAACPCCHQTSARTHARYQRRLMDLPWQGRLAVLLVRVRRFRCGNPNCPRQTFAEPLGSVAGRSARRRARLAGLQCQLGLALGGEAGARIATRLTMPASPDTLLRLVHGAMAPLHPAPRVLAVDDWAWRRGQNYGTILVDLERNRVVDLLPDRETSTLSAWLRCHGGIEVVARDRAGAYADAVRQGAPDALQVTDCWHLLRNLGEALQGGVDRHRGAVHQAARAVSERTATPAEPVLRPATRKDRLRADRRDDRQICYEEILRLHRLGLPGHAIGRAVGAPHPVQWLADNGYAYIAHDTRDFAVALNLVACFTPVHSPESNGVSEAFVKTLKRDYARINPRPDAATVLQQLPGWIEDYNESHPHKGLRMHSPREFIRAQSQPAPCPV